MIDLFVDFLSKFDDIHRLVFVYSLFRTRQIAIWSPSTFTHFVV